MKIHKDLLCVKNYKVNTLNTYIHFVFNFRSLFTILLICLTVYPLFIYLLFFFASFMSKSSFFSTTPETRPFLFTKKRTRDLKVGWNFYRQVCLYGYKFHVENKLKKKPHKYVVVKRVGLWIIKEINCGGYLSLLLIDDWIAKYLTW